MLAFLHQGGHDLCHLLFSCYILIFTDIKRQVNAQIFPDNRASIALGGKTFFFQFVQVTADRFLRNIIKLAEFTDYNPLFCL